MSTKSEVSQIATILAILLLVCAVLPAQTVNSIVIGRVVDPTNAVVTAAAVTLTDQNTGSIRTAVTDSSGVFRFPDILPSTYTLFVRMKGFKAETVHNLVVSASETHEVGSLTLQIGDVTETIAVTAEATPIQLASSEQSQVIDANQLENVTLKGRDLFGYMHLIPGVIDTTAARDVTNPNAIGGITINGNTLAKNFTVDGITDMDTGSNGTLHYEPNIDAIQELKVLSSNYQAEFGRNAGGTITVVTKAGTRDFHFTGQWTHRHEEFNANNWLNDHSPQSNGLAAAKPRYRYNVETYTVGGPVLIPKLWNRERKKLFFFWSQEYTGQFVAGSAQTKYTPTALERQGNFSQTFANNGSLIVITNPLAGAPFAGNIIPPQMADPTGFGPATLNYFPLPNEAPGGSQANIVNYFESASAQHPRRNDVLRLDPYITSKIQGYFRYINDHDDLSDLYQGVQFSAPSPLLPKGSPPIDHPNPGHGYSGSVVETITPTLINETTVGYSWNTWSWYTTDKYADESRSLIANIPSLFPLPTATPSGVVATNGYFNLLPEFQYGGSGTTEPNAMTYTKNSTSAGNYFNENPIWTFTDNLSKVFHSHSIKTGFYLEHNIKLQPNGAVYAGNYNFQPDTNNPLNTGDGYANAYLGYVDQYSQATAAAQFNVLYWNFEVYLQDNWRVSKRLTLDYGVRFYHQGPQNDLNHTFSNFSTSAYTRAAAPRIYIPGTSSGERVAIDPGTGAVAPVAYIGLYVPNSGNPADGLALAGQNGVSSNTYDIGYMRPAPRFGFAYDLTGDGKTALRGGYGIFFNRLDGNQVYGLSGLPPYAYTPQVNYTTTTAISQSGGTLIYGPPTITSWPTKQIPWNYVENASLDVQHTFGSWLADVGYSLNLTRHSNLSYDLNALPLGTYFQPSSLDPTNGNKPLPDILLRSNFYGFNTVNQYAEIGTANYNALNAQLTRRFSHGLAIGVAYTFSHALGATSYTPDVPSNHSWNYGNLSTNRPHNLGINWSYDLPMASQYIGKFFGAITDHWTFSGVASVQSGVVYNPSFAFSSGTVPSYTGTSAVTARMLVVGNPYANVPAGSFFNPAAFALPALGTSSPSNPILGDMGGGAGLLELPHITNFDMTLSKFIPVFGERRGFKIMVQAYNIFNHTEYSGLNSRSSSTRPAASCPILRSRALPTQRCRTGF